MIEFTNVSFAYAPRRPLFEGLSLAVERGSTVGLVGPNGAGKSTLLKLAAGLLHAERGSIECNGHPVWPRSRAATERLFYMAEDFRLPAVSVGALGGLFGRFYPAYSAERFTELVGRFELKGADPIYRLSFGGTKKAMLAFGLASGAEVLLLDEPTNGLDPTAKEVLASELAERAAEGATTVVATHHLDAVEPLLSHLVVLGEGRVVLRASCAELSERLRFGAVDPERALYCRPTLGGVYGIERCAGCDSSLDLTLLYEAVRHNPELFNEFSR